MAEASDKFAQVDLEEGDVGKTSLIVFLKKLKKTKKTERNV